MNNIRQCMIKVLSSLVITAMSVMIIMVVWQVVSRYVFGTPSKFSEEIATAMMIWVGTFGAALGFERGAHLGVDLLIQFVSPTSKTIMNNIILCLILIFAVLIWTVGGIKIVLQAFESANMLKTLPYICRGWVYMPIPICGLFLTFFTILRLIKKQDYKK